MHVLIVVPRQDRTTGNWVTATRFQAGLEALGHQVTVRDTPLEPEAAFHGELTQHPPDVALLLHAYRSGRPWLEAAAGLDIPMVVMLTGTDVNLGLADPQQEPTIRAVLEKASVILHHNRLLANELVSRLPLLTTKTEELAAGISLGTEPYNLRQRHGLPSGQPLFLCPAGVRAVKGLRPLLDLFDQVDPAASGLQIAYCGPILDNAYADDFLHALSKRVWAHYLGVIPTAAMAQAMLGADVIVNNSQAEGLSNALLEAATLGIPILARNIPGNAAVVEHGVNGLLYEDAATFAAGVRALADPLRREQLSRLDSARYNPARETAQLAAILKRAGRARHMT